MSVEVRYLKVKWRNQQTVLTCEEAEETCKVESISSSEYEVETYAFPNVFKERSNNEVSILIGFCFSELDSEEVPNILLADGTTKPLFELKTPTSRKRWWVAIDNWNSNENRYYSQLYQKVGRIDIVTTKEKLYVYNNVSSFTVKELESLLDDFNGELIELILNNDSSVKANRAGAVELPVIFSSDTIELYSKFLDAVKNISKYPNKNLVEISKEVPRIKVKPIRKTFIEYSMRPFANKFTGRIHEESLDTQENRYTHYQLDNVLQILRRIFSLYNDYPNKLKKQIHSLTQQLNSINCDKVLVNKEVFVNQQARELARVREIQNAIDEFNNWCHHLHKENSYYDQNLSYYTVTFSYSKNNRRDTYSIDSVEIGNKKYTTEDFSINKLHLPRRCWGVIEFDDILKDHIKKVCCLSRKTKFKISLSANGRAEKPKSDTKPFTIHFKNILLSSVRLSCPEMNELKVKEQQLRIRTKLINNNWIKDLDDREIEEYRLARQQLKNRLSQLTSISKQINSSHEMISKLYNKALIIKDFFLDNKIGLSSKIPYSLVMSMNHNYASSYFLYQQILNKFGISEKVLDLLLSSKSIGLENTWTIYEKWCLIRLFKALQSLNYSLEKNWQEKLLLAVKNHRKGEVFQFNPNDGNNPKISLWYEKEYSTNRGIKYPDFVLEIENFLDESDVKTVADKIKWKDISLKLKNIGTKTFVLDAKFKNWSENQLINTLENLYVGKDYSLRGTVPVFLIHPEANIVSTPISPLIWATDCDYGGDGSNHQKGHILLSPSSRHISSHLNLKRLLVMFLQQCKPNICPNCGGHISRSQVKQTKGNLYKFKHHCVNCGTVIYENHCHKCPNIPLFKNGYLWSYHVTSADSIFNIHCPSCGYFFDGNSESWNR